MFLIVLGLSIILGIVMVGIALFLIFSKPKEEGNGNAVRATVNAQSEPHDFWYNFGFVDDTPNLIRAVVSGKEKVGRIIRYMYPEDDDGELLESIRKHFGKRWYGIPFIQNVKPLIIDRVTSKNTELPQKTLSDELKASTVTKYGLYRKILRPTLHKDVDTKNNVRFSVISYVEMEVVDPKPAFEIYFDSLLQTASKIVSGILSRKALSLEYDKYKERGNRFDLNEIDEINLALAPLGLRVKQITMGDPELHPDIQKALQQQAEAEQTAKAARMQGAGERDRKKLVADGDRYAKEQDADATRYAMEQAAIGRRKKFEELIELYYSKGATYETAVRMSNAQIVAEINASAVEKLQGTYAPNTGSIIALK